MNPYNYYGYYNNQNANNIYNQNRMHWTQYSHPPMFNHYTDQYSAISHTFDLPGYPSQRNTRATLCPIENLSTNPSYANFYFEQEQDDRIPRENVSLDSEVENLNSKKKHDTDLAKKRKKKINNIDENETQEELAEEIGRISDANKRANARSSRKSTLFLKVCFYI